MAVINKKLPKTRDFEIKFGNVTYDPNKNDQMIQDQGVRVKVYKTVICPNVKSIDGGEHNIECKVCDNGFVDLDPFESYAYVANQTADHDHRVEGVMDDMSVAATFLSGIDVQYFAKIELIDFTTQFFQLVQRQEGEVDRLRYRAFKVNLVIDRSGVRYYEGTDFELSPNKDIQWMPGRNRPPETEPYSIHYDYHITYRAIQAMHINRFTNTVRKQAHKTPVQMSQQWMLRRDFHISRDDLDGNALTKNRIFEYDNL